MAGKVSKTNVANNEANLARIKQLKAELKSLGAHNNEVNRVKQSMGRKNATQKRKNKQLTEKNKQLNNTLGLKDEAIDKLKETINEQSNKIAGRLKTNKSNYSATIKVGDQDISISMPTRGTFKKLIKELSQSQAFANKPASVRNVEKITNGIVALGSAESALDQSGYTNEAQKIRTISALTKDLFDTVSANPELAEVLSKVLNNASDEISASKPSGD